MGRSYTKVPKVKRGPDGKYPMTDEQKVRSAKQIEGKFMIATEAKHKMGDLSRNLEHLSMENLCYVSKETDEFLIGNWLTGFGYFDVMFPKETTRVLTQEEIDYFNGKYIQLASFPPQKLKVD